MGIPDTHKRIVKSVSLFYMFTQLVSEISSISITQRDERLLHFTESEADQLCILGVYLKYYALAGMPLCLLVKELISLITCVNM